MSLRPEAQPHQTGLGDGGEATDPSEMVPERTDEHHPAARPDGSSRPVDPGHESNKTFRVQVQGILRGSLATSDPE